MIVIDVLKKASNIAILLLLIVVAVLLHKGCSKNATLKHVREALKVAKDSTSYYRDENNVLHAQAQAQEMDNRALVYIYQDSLRILAKQLQTKPKHVDVVVKADVNVSGEANGKIERSDSEVVSNNTTTISTNEPVAIASIKSRVTRFSIVDSLLKGTGYIIDSNRVKLFYTVDIKGLNIAGYYKTTRRFLFIRWRKKYFVNMWHENKNVRVDSIRAIKMKRG